MRTALRVILALCCMLFLLPGSLLHAQMNPFRHDSASLTTSGQPPLFGFGQGYLNAGYTYGLSPLMVRDSSATGYFRLEGNQQVSVRGIPFSVTGYYSSLKNVTGLNNSIRVSFDAAAYREKLKNQLKEKTLQLGDSIKQLQASAQQYEKQLYYLKYLQTLNPDQYKRRLQMDRPKLPADTLQSIIPPNTDSLKPDLPKVQQPAVSLPAFTLPQGENYRDSLNRLVTAQQEKLNSVTMLIAQLKTQVHRADSLLRDPKVPSASLPGNRFFTSVQNLQIGMCYPSFSPFLLSGIPLRGFSMELERNNYYFAAAAGKTISNLLFTPDLVQQNLNNVRNLYNFFDFNSVESGRNIAAVKAGRGKKDGTHLFAGLLYGKGLESYWLDSSATALNTEQQEKNWVAEIDARFDISPNHHIGLNYAKSVVKQISADPELEATQQLNWLDTRYRSNALQVNYSGKFPKLRSNITAAVRWVDPYFRSFGAGFVRQDNIRGEIRTDHQLGKKLRVGFNVRRDANNLLRLYDQFTVLQSAGVSVSLKITSRFQVRATYNPVFQQVKANGELIYTNNNQIANASVSWRPKMRKWTTTVTGLYSYYKLFDGTANREYGNSFVSITTQSRKGWRFGAQLAGYTISPVDSLQAGSTIASADAGYNWKCGVQVQAGMRYAWTTLYGDHPGFSCQVIVPLCKRAALLLEGQRLIPGDFYNSYSMEQFDKFPYLCSAQLMMNW